MHENARSVNGSPTGYLVTRHAVRRYIERALGFRFSPRWGDEEVISHWERTTGQTRDVIRDTIACEVHCKIGAPQRALPAVTVPIFAGRAVVEQGHVVVTVYERG